MERIVLTLPESEVPPVAETRLNTVDDLANQLMRLVKLVQWLGAHNSQPETDGVERSAYRVLGRLVREGPHRLTVLAEILHSDMSTVSRQTSGLVKAGLLERRPDAADGRACLLAATDEGHRVFEHNRRHRDALISQMLDAWSDGEVRDLAAGLERFNAAVEARAPAPAPAPRAAGAENGRPEGDADARDGDRTTQGNGETDQ